MAQFGIELVTNYDKKTDEAIITIKLKNVSMIGLENEIATRNLGLWIICKIMNPEDYENDEYENEIPNTNLN